MSGAAPVGRRERDASTHVDDKIIPIDASAAALAGQLEAKALAAGQDPGMADALIAAVAQAQDLVIINHNT